jgi:hypothetical protein
MIDIDKEAGKHAIFEFWVKKEDEIQVLEGFDQLTRILKKEKTVPTELVNKFLGYFINPETAFGDRIRDIARDVVKKYEERFSGDKNYMFSFKKKTDYSIGNTNSNEGLMNFSVKIPESEVVTKTWADLIYSASVNFLFEILKDKTLHANKKQMVKFFYAEINDFFRQVDILEHLGPRKHATICGFLTITIAKIALNSKAKSGANYRNEDLYQGVVYITRELDINETNFFRTSHRIINPVLTKS